MMEAVSSSETSVNIPEASNLQSRKKAGFHYNEADIITA
jgi:hypothetical protein